MAMMSQRRKLSVSIHDYPEHLNPFYEDDNHNRIRFWTIGKGTRSRSSSFSLSGLKDFRNTWTLRSFMKKGKKDPLNDYSQKKHSATPAPAGNESPIVYRKPPIKAPQTTTSRNTMPGTQPDSDRYVYGGSVTPLPRSRFQERVRGTMQPDSNGFSHNSPGRSSFSHRSGEPYALPGLSRCSLAGSRLSMESVNPFDEDAAGHSLVRASRRKKKRAPPPPPHSTDASLMSTSLTMTDISMNSSTITESELSTNNTSLPKLEIEEEDHSFNIELKIVEHEPEEKSNHDSQKITDFQISTDQNGNHQETATKTITKSPELVRKEQDTETETPKECNNNESVMEPKISDQTDDKNIKPVCFDKVNVKLYRQNSRVSQSSLNVEPVVEHPPDLDSELSTLANGFNTTLHINEEEDVVEARTKEKHVTINDGKEKPQVVICKLVDNRHSRKYSTDNSISSMERDFLEIDRATKELELEINRLNVTADGIDETPVTAMSQRRSVSEMKMMFDSKGQSAYSPNPIPKPRRSRVELSSPDLSINNLPTL